MAKGNTRHAGATLCDLSALSSIRIDTGRAGMAKMGGWRVKSWASRPARWLLAAASMAGLAAAMATPAPAQRVENSVAVFAALDKVTAKISRLEIPLNQTVSFGALKITPRACYSRAPTEPPKTSTFVEVDEVMLDDKEKRIFSGWMFAESPGLNAVEHPVFDVWLTECAAPARMTATPRQPATTAGATQTPAAGQRTEEDPDAPRRRRVPRY
jgi:hypothetical protein